MENQLSESPNLENKVAAAWRKDAPRMKPPHHEVAQGSKDLPAFRLGVSSISMGLGHSSTTQANELPKATWGTPLGSGTMKLLFFSRKLKSDAMDEA